MKIPYVNFKGKKMVRNALRGPDVGGSELTLDRCSQHHYWFFCLLPFPDILSKSVSQTPCESGRSFLGKRNYSSKNFCPMVQSAVSRGQGHATEQLEPAFCYMGCFCFFLVLYGILGSSNNSKHASLHECYWQLAQGRFPDTWLSAGATLQSSPWDGLA